MHFEIYNPEKHYSILSKWYMNEEILNYMEIDKKSDSELKTWLGDATRIHLVFFDNNEPIGCVNFYNWKTKAPNYEVGYLVDPQQAGKGYATAMLKETLIYAKDILKAKRIENVYVIESNPASKRVLEKNDFVFDRFDEIKKRFYFFKDLN